MSNNDPNLLQNILFTDKAKFYINSHVDRHNMYYWSPTNPHWFRPPNMAQDKRNINVWVEEY